MLSKKSSAIPAVRIPPPKIRREVSLELSVPKVQRSYASSNTNAETQGAGASDEMHKFKAVLAQAKIKRAARLATRIRWQGTKHAQSDPGAPRRLHRLRFSCKVMLAAAHHGSYNVLFTIRFLDGVQWLLKIPANGTFDAWDEDSAEALTSEVLTMKLIRNNSSIPVSCIHGFSATTANELDCPYVLMECIKGINLFCGWFYNFSSPTLSQDCFRERAVANIAKAMVQLNIFTFPTAGALQYNATAKTFDIGPYPKVDHWIDPENGACYSQHGPFSDPKEYFLSSLNKSDMTNVLHTHSSGFVLTHPDFTLHNIIMGKNGSLRGFVDWDGVVAVPRYWNYDPKHDCIVAEPVMLLAELEQYRTLYAQSVDSALRESSLPPKRSVLSPDEKPSCGEQRPSSRTRASCLARCLYISANEPRTLSYNIDMLLEKTISLTAGERFDDVQVNTYDNTGTNHGNQAMERVEGASLEHKPAVHDAEDVHEQCESHTTLDESCSASTLEDDKHFVPTLSEDSTPTIDHVGASCIAASSSIEHAIGWTFPDTLNLACLPHNLCYHHTTVEHWRSNRLMWVAMIFLFILSTPAFFIMLMDWLHSLDMLPLALAFAGLMFPSFGLLTNSVALLLRGLFFAHILEQRFAESSTTGGKTMEPGEMKLPEPCPTLNDDELVDREKTADSARLHSALTTFVINDAAHPTSGVREEYPSSTLLLAQDDSDSSEDSSDKSDDTKNTGPSLHGSPERGRNAVRGREYFGPRGEDLLEMEFEERFERIKQIWKEDPTWDFGLFDDRDIYNALYRGSIDAARMRRLKVSFQRLLASLDDRFAKFDGLTLSDG
ncbi:MAG: hypothetical protein Q9207_006520 [Kuettlingeria erythrocarpa]